MTLYSFCLLSPVVQLCFVLKYGTYLAQRWEEIPVDLYHFPNEGSGFFVEVGTEYEPPLVLRSSVSSVPLDSYANYVELPELYRRQLLLKAGHVRPEVGIIEQPPQR